MLISVHQDDQGCGPGVCVLLEESGVFGLCPAPLLATCRSAQLAVKELAGIAPLAIRPLRPFRAVWLNHSVSREFSKVSYKGGRAVSIKRELDDSGVEAARKVRAAVAFAVGWGPDDSGAAAGAGQKYGVTQSVGGHRLHKRVRLQPASDACGDGVLLGRLPSSQAPGPSPGDATTESQVCRCAKPCQYFGSPGAEASCCSKCSGPDVVEVRRPTCRCGKRFAPSFGIPGGKAVCCSKCKDLGMVDLRHATCRCGKRPSFGVQGGKAVCCPTCKDSDMVYSLRHAMCRCGKRS
ncbi:unnamed protein product [Polarella glacialis]|uniref:Uncharacterized protein n=1 Tax=Polarella glacialis TaxID=89957 RepID=A0A813F1M4_POLGL|nr:unnamed protein product [Polarella glacialis]